MKTLAVDQVLDGSVYDPETKRHIATHRYQVVKVTNSISPKIGDSLDVGELFAYCDSEDWNVTIK